MNSNDAGQPPGANPSARPRRRRRGHLRMVAANGAEIVLLTDKEGRTITVDAADFDRLCSLKLSDQWFTHGNGKPNENGKRNEYVRAQCRLGQRSQPTTVARLILEVSSGRNVRYRDGNPHNLRRANLYLEDGYAKGNTDTVLRIARAGDAF